MKLNTIKIISIFVYIIFLVLAIVFVGTEIPALNMSNVALFLVIPIVSIILGYESGNLNYKNCILTILLNILGYLIYLLLSNLNPNLGGLLTSGSMSEEQFLILCVGIFETFIITNHSFPLRSAFFGVERHKIALKICYYT